MEVLEFSHSSTYSAAILISGRKRDLLNPSTLRSNMRICELGKSRATQNLIQFLFVDTHVLSVISRETKGSDNDHWNTHATAPY